MLRKWRIDWGKRGKKIGRRRKLFASYMLILIQLKMIIRGLLSRLKKKVISSWSCLKRNIILN
jgi:hypothetical protein